MVGPARTAIAVEPGRAPGAGSRAPWRPAAARWSPPAEAGAVVWGHHADADGLAALLADHPQLAWVQLPVGRRRGLRRLIRRYADRTWTCGKGVYAEPVAEHALALALAGLRHLGTYARATEWGTGARAQPARRPGHGPRRRRHHRVAPPPARPVRVRRHRRPPHARSRCRAPPGSSAPTASTRRSTGADVRGARPRPHPRDRRHHRRRRLRLLAPHAWVVNVARGGHIVTDDLVAALADGHDRRRRARRHRPRAAARRPPAVGRAALHHHAAHGQHASRWPSRCCGPRVARTSAAGSPASRCSAPSTSPPATEPTVRDAPASGVAAS